MRLLNRLRLNYYSQRNFTPKSISGLALWLDASDLATITKDGSNYVSQWNDKSGKGFNVAQATGSAQPLWASNTITFDNDYLLSASGLDLLKNKSGGTLLFVGEVLNGTDPGTILGIVGINTGTASRLLLRASASDVTKIDTGGRRLDANSLETTNAESYSYATRYIFTSILDYANAKAYLYFNNVLKQTDDPFQTAGSTSDTTTNGLALGNNLFGNATVTNKIKANEVILYEKALTSTELTNINNYLSRKWGVTI